MASASKVQAHPSADSVPGRCPLCGSPNDCQLCTAAADKGSCWCVTTPISGELLARGPVASWNRACICRGCVAAFYRERADNPPLPIVPGEFYFGPDGLMVFTAAYHLRRGYCCENNCRHCPFDPAK